MYRKLQIWSDLLKKSLMENSIFCAVFLFSNKLTIFAWSVRRKTYEEKHQNKVARNLFKVNNKNERTTQTDINLVPFSLTSVYIRPMFQSYENSWFLYEWNIGLGWVKDIRLLFNAFLQFLVSTFTHAQKQQFIGVSVKRCSENMQQIYRKTPITRCDFNKVAWQFQ